MPRKEPYPDIADLPEEEVQQYSKQQRAAFKSAFNRALEKGKKEDQALREAHIEAKQLPLGSRPNKT